MAPAFSQAEYGDRLRRVRHVMRNRGLDAIIIGDPSNINWLCGYDAWSFYTPQMMLVDLDHGPFWICLLYTSPSPRDRTRSRMPSSA